MNPDLTFVKSETHLRLLNEILEQAYRDSEVIGVMLSGSVARGDAYPGSDLDVDMLLRDGCSRPSQSEVRRGILVERKYADFARSKSKLEKNPMQVYGYLDGRILYDPEGRLTELTDMARARFEAYTVPAGERDAISYWLKSAKCKMVAAWDAGDELKAAYVVSVTSWKVLEGLWAANDRPVPPGGGVWAHVKDLHQMPPAIETLLPRLFEGDARGRVEAAIRIIDWVVPVLDRRENDVS